MTDIDISHDLRVVRLARLLQDWGQHDEGAINDARDDAANALRALSAALTQANAKAEEAKHAADDSITYALKSDAALTQSRAETAAAYERAAQSVAHLGMEFDVGGSPTAKAVLDLSIDHIRALVTQDQTAALAVVVRAAVEDALECARAQDEQGLAEGLLITSLAHCIAVSDAEARGMRKAAAIAWAQEDGERWTRASIQAAILAAIPKGGDA